MAVHIVSEADRCLQCKKPLCKQGCPISTPIPEVIALFKERRIQEAAEKLFQNNPMSAMCSVVCDHAAQCQGGCVLGRKGAAVHFSAIEQYLSETYLDRARLAPAPKNGKRVAVIGSGPAGLTAAVKLAQAGCEVTVFERAPHLGGVLRYGIPEFRLPKSVLDRYERLLKSLGVHVRPGVDVGDALTIGDMIADGYDAVFVGTGAGRAKKVGMPGEARADVHFGVDYLQDPEAFQIGEKVAVLGAGNVAMDVARTALRHGAREVTIYARSQHVSANADEVEMARLDGAELVLGRAVEGVNDQGPYFRVAIFDEDGTVTGYEDQTEQRAADTTFVCVSQMPKNRLVTTTQGLMADGRGRLMVDKEFMTTVPGIFAAGDVVAGPKTVVHAAADAKRAADMLLAYLGVTSPEDGC